MPGEFQDSNRLTRVWREWRLFIVFLAVMLVFRSAVADWNHVPSGSMIPTILIGDRIVVDKLAYDLRVPFTLNRLGRWDSPARGDVVTFESPADGRLLVKRVVGIPGDRITLADNQLAINGTTASYRTLTATELDLPLPHHSRYQLQEERILGHSRVVQQLRTGRPEYQSFGPVTVPPDHYLMLGDNRDNSQDYRAIGFVHRDLITGRATRVAFSVDYDHYYLPRSERFFKPLQWPAGMAAARELTGAGES